MRSIAILLITILPPSHTLLIGTSLQTPILKFYTPNSILLEKHLYKPMPVGDRMRHATCTSAAWFHGHYLALANLYGRHIRIYFFDEQKHRVHLIQEITDDTNTHLHMPEQIAISPDETLVALADAFKPGVHFYTISPNHHVSNRPILSLPQKGLVHNVRFSPAGTHCACLCYDQHRSLLVYAIDHKAHTKLILRETFRESNDSLLRLKAIYFTKQGNFAILAYALSIVDSTRMPHESKLVVRTFDQEQGTLGAVVCTVPGTFSIEDLCLSRDEKHLFATDQAHDQLLIYPFNRDTGIINPRHVAYTNPDAQLSFPHGINISRDGRYVAVTNYGDDSCTIYALPNCKRSD